MFRNGSSLGRLAWTCSVGKSETLGCVSVLPDGGSFWRFISGGSERRIGACPASIELIK
jgi:hypothetical protein